MRPALPLRPAVLGLLATLAACAPSTVPPAPTAPVGPPPTRIETVTDVSHGVEIEDPYRWLETTDDPEVDTWIRAQDDAARELLEGLPEVEALRGRIDEVFRHPSTSYGGLATAGGRLFGLVKEPEASQALLAELEAIDAEPVGYRPIVLPEGLDPEGLTTVDWYEPSPDGSLVAVSLSRAGTELGDLHLFDVATGEPVGEPIPRVNAGTGGGDVAWAPDGGGLYYTRYPRVGERPPEDDQFFMQVWFHDLRDGSDRYELGEELPRIAEIALELEPQSGRLLATVQEGDSGRFELHLRDRDGSWHRLTTYDSGVVQGTFAGPDDLLLVSRDGAPRGQILRRSADPRAPGTTRVVVPEGEDAIETNFWGAFTTPFVDGRLFVQYQTGGPSELRVFDADGTALGAPDLPPVTAVGSVTGDGRGGILVRASSYLEPTAWYRFDPATGATTRTALASSSPFDTSDLEVRREWCTSADGTRVPLNIIVPQGLVLDGSHPMVVTGYGGYGLSRRPGFRSTALLLLERGVLYADVNLRGGSEFGADWHEGGRLTKKQNVFDDFAAALAHVTERGYTSPERLAIIGGSNGGLLMGATLVQHPQAVRAVVSLAGIYDMLRVELSPNGAFNIPEFGTVEDPEQFHALAAYSPYHHVEDGTDYPAVLLTSALNDPRVEPMQSHKMAARLQAATASDEPILVRTLREAGHGGAIGVAPEVEEWTEILAFLLWQLGVTAR